MRAYTFGQLLHVIELGQTAEAADGERRMQLLTEGLVWLNGPYAGQIVRVQGYLLSDLWTIVEDESSAAPSEERIQWQRRRLEMLENQWFDQRERRFERTGAKGEIEGSGGHGGAENETV
ncbi:hypothetical protein [Saccharibacillus qingshengii]|uniref:hypothetical protein n=1 Tax=Saccharibacillus qingshengii TaxID=1763540 RepID=UPI001552EEC4|nr:hypothetical protein [Saccharibacillus qingshengii]